MSKGVLAARCLVGLLVVGTWEAAARLCPVSFDPHLFGQPSAIVRSFVSYASSGFLWQDTLATGLASIIGLGVGMVLGLLVGLLLAASPFVYRVLEPYIVALNSLPRPALAPLLVLWLGLGLASKVFVSISLVFFVVFYNTFRGVQSVRPDYLDVLTVMGASRLQLFRLVILPSIRGWLFAGFQTSVSLSLIGAVVGEFVGSARGLGYRMMIATGVFDTQLAFAILLWLGFLGVVAVTGGGIVEQRVIRWEQSRRSRNQVSEAGIRMSLRG